MNPPPTNNTNKLREASERIFIACMVVAEFESQESIMVKIESVLREVVEEAVKDARRKWISKADPFVQECIKLAEETGRAEAIEECRQIADRCKCENCRCEKNIRERALKP